MYAFWGFHFVICNGFISAFLVIFIVIKRLVKNYISNQMQYKLWYLLFALLIVPFLPASSFAPSLSNLLYKAFFSANSKGITSNFSSASVTQSMPSYIKQNFSISVDSNTQQKTGIFLFYIWLTGAAIMLLLTALSYWKLKRLNTLASPIQNEQIKSILNDCKNKVQIQSNVSIYCTNYFKSPISAGLLHSKIYLPKQLIDNFSNEDLRFILLHELIHYKRKDIIGNVLIILFRILYWFNPFIWFGFDEMKHEREIACDSSVLNILSEDDYKAYGFTLIRFAQKISHLSFSHCSEIGGSNRQIKKRIQNIASFRPITGKKKELGYAFILLIALFVIEYSTFLSVYAHPNDTPAFTNSITTVYEDLSLYFKGYDGSFVLYNENTNIWTIYNKDLAVKRVSPNSTYKIYSALFSLETKQITPADSMMKWDGKDYPFSEWNKNQTLTTAMQSSVNWYFQALDKQAGLSALQQFYNKINYGNCNLSSGVSNYWMEASLKISPLEQVQLLKDLHANTFQFNYKNIQTVKQAIRLTSSSKGTLYGKTGTGKVDDKDVNGWFIGLIESNQNTYTFAVNIQNDTGADGAKASEIAFNILKNKKIYSIK